MDQAWPSGPGLQFSPQLSVFMPLTCCCALRMQLLPCTEHGFVSPARPAVDTCRAAEQDSAEEVPVTQQVISEGRCLQGLIS